MSKIRLKSVKVKNYRSFGEEQAFLFPNEDFKKPVAIVGYNNCGKTNLMNSILIGLGQKYTSKESISINDFHNRAYSNVPSIILNVESSVEKKYDGKDANLTGQHSLNIQMDGECIEGAKIESTKVDGSANWAAFGASKYFNIFYVNFHNIKDEISTQKTSWGNLKSFLAKHIKSVVENDALMLAKKDVFESEIIGASKKVLKDSVLSAFVEKIKVNYSANLRDNNCEVAFELPAYEDIFLQMMFKIGLNGDSENLIPIDHFGDGFISMFVMAVIQAIAENNTADQCLFLFEEPESFLHENHQEYFYKMVLCSLAEKGHQVIYTTHSDRMVDVFDTKGIIRLEFDEDKKQTVKKYNNTGEFNPTIASSDGVNELISLANYNSFIKSVEPNLNRILFSRKVILVEGPNDLLVYKTAIEKEVEKLKGDKRYAQTYLSFLNIAIIVHHGKATAWLLIDLCKHFGLDYFAINDWDFTHDFITSLDTFKTEVALKSSTFYLKDITGADRNSDIKGLLTTNWKLLNSATIEKIHFNISKLESVLGYTSNDKNSLKIKNKVDSLTTFDEKLFPQKLKDFLEFNKIPRVTTSTAVATAVPATP